MLIVDRRAWWLLAGSALGLELTAIWFQYGMGLDPCVKCVYQRLAVMGLILAGVVGSVFPRALLLRLVGYVVWGVSAAWGLQQAMQHVGIQSDEGSALSCNFFAEFPTWAKLDEWWPALFQPTGYCDDVQWQWMSLTMAQWMVVVFGVYLLVLAVVLLIDARARFRP